MNIDDSLRLFGLADLDGQTEETLKKLYHHLAQQYHPDKGGSSEEFIALRKAYIFLRTSLIDPSKNSQSSAKNSRYQQEKSYYSDDTNNQTGQNHYSSDAQQEYSYSDEPVNPYQEAYMKAVEQIKQYEDVFNAQIRIINSTNKTISERYSGYSTKRDELKNILDANLATLNKKYFREWWQYVIPVPKIDRGFYIKQYNSFVESYNSEVKQIDEKYIQGLLNTYQSGFEQIIDYLK